MLGYVTHNSSKRVTLHQKVGMSKAAYHRMPVGGLEGLGGGEVRQTLKHDRAAQQTTAVQFHTGTREMQ